PLAVTTASPETTRTPHLRALMQCLQLPGLLAGFAPHQGAGNSLGARALEEPDPAAGRPARPQTPPPTPAVRMPPATWNRADTLVLLSWIQLPRQQGTGGEQRRGRRPPRGGRRRRWALGQAPQGAVVGAARAVRPDRLGDRAAGA